MPLVFPTRALCSSFSLFRFPPCTPTFVFYGHVSSRHTRFSETYRWKILKYSCDTSKKIILSSTNVLLDILMELWNEITYIIGISIHLVLFMCARDVSFSIYFSGNCNLRFNFTKTFFLLNFLRYKSFPQWFRFYSRHHIYHVIFYFSSWITLNFFKSSRRISDAMEALCP